MQSRLRTLAQGLALTLLAATPAFADDPAPNCRASDVMKMTPAEIQNAGPLAPYHPKVVLERLAGLLGRQAYREAMAAVVEDARKALDTGRVESAMILTYMSRLTRADSTFAIALTLPYNEQARYVADTVMPVNFFLTQVRGNFPIFARTDSPIIVTDAMRTDQQRALCWTTLTVYRVFILYGARNRAETVQALDALAGRWEKYVDNSYSQLPWELLVNGLIRGRSGYEPPTGQFILLHPSVGVEANGTVFKELRRVDVAVFEPFGYVRYNGDYTRYLGVSSAVTFASNRNIAVGGYVHLWFPQAKVGYVVRSDPDHQRRGSALVSMDLYDFLTGVPQQLKSVRESALGKKLLDVTGVTKQ
jgi:hypothetical protein